MYQESKFPQHPHKALGGDDAPSLIQGAAFWVRKV